jgi:TolA-binding protein
MTASELAKAITLLKNIVDDGKQRPIQKKAQELLDGIEKQASYQLAKARQLSDSGKSVDAAEELTNLVRNYPGTAAAVEAGNLLSKTITTPDVIQQTRTQLARTLLAEAKQFYTKEKYFLCLQRCRTLKEEYGDLDEGKEALQLDKAIRGNPVWMEQTCQDLNEQLSDMYLSLAYSWQERGQREKALMYLQKVIDTSPNSPLAEAAELRMNQLNGTPTLRVEFKNP